MNPLEEAIVIATQAHAGAVDKGGEPYILHPLRVMLNVHAEAEHIAAVLHDVVENSGWTLEALRERGFSEEVLRAVDHLTLRPGETYEEYVQRAAQDPVALRVKIADLEDNLDMTRLNTRSGEDHHRKAKYERALLFLIEQRDGRSNG